MGKTQDLKGSKIKRKRSKRKKKKRKMGKTQDPRGSNIKRRRRETWDGRDPRSKGIKYKEKAK